MPPSKPKPSEIATEAKRIYMPHIAKHLIRDPNTSYLFPDTAAIRAQAVKPQQRLRVAVVEGDPVDYALGWYQYISANPAYASNQQTPVEHKRIPVVNMANEKRAGGDWESGAMAPEECFARRSNLVHALTMPWSANSNLYPIPQRGGIYSPLVYVYRDGPEQYTPWKEMNCLPVISVAPVRRPKLDETGTRYSFVQEKELMREKMRSVLRIAANRGHPSICIGAFGVGPVFRNPVAEVARMWRKLLFEEAEFQGIFTDVVFAIDNSLSRDTSNGNMLEIDVFRNEFDPSAIVPTRYR